MNLSSFSFYIPVCNSIGYSNKIGTLFYTHLDLEPFSYDITKVRWWFVIILNILVSWNLQICVMFPIGTVQRNFLGVRSESFVEEEVGCNRFNYVSVSFVIIVIIFLTRIYVMIIVIESRISTYCCRYDSRGSILVRSELCIHIF